MNNITTIEDDENSSNNAVYYNNNTSEPLCPPNTPSPPPITITNNNNNDLLNMMYTFVNNHLQIDNIKTKIGITDKSIKIINVFLKICPDIFTQIETNINQILIDDIIDIHDIPIIIVMIKDIYNINYKTLGKNVTQITFTQEELIIFIQDIILIMIEFEYILVSNKQKTINMVKSSINLLSSSLEHASTIFNLINRYCCCCKT
jgi:hypothetical protein